MSPESVELYSGPVDESGDYIFNQERLERDFTLTQRIQAGYTLPDVNPETGKKPRVIDGSLTEDAQAALSELWEAYTSLAFKTANSFNALIREVPAIDNDDLVGECFFGLYHASVKWNLSKNITFLTLASNQMRNYAARYIDNCRSTVRLPGGARSDVYSANRALWGIYMKSGHSASKEKIARVIGVSVAKAESIAKASAITNEMGSTDRGFFADDRDRASTFGKRPSDVWKPIDPAASEMEPVESTVMQRALQDTVASGLANPKNGPFRSVQLTAREINVLKMRFYDTDNKTFEEIGEELGVTGQRIGQIEREALKKLRLPRIRRLLEDFLRD